MHPGDRIEHAAVVPVDCLADLAELELTVVTQPNVVAERGDEYRAEIAADELDQPWRVRPLRAVPRRVAVGERGDCYRRPVGLVGRATGTNRAADGLIP